MLKTLRVYFWSSFITFILFLLVCASGLLVRLEKIEANNQNYSDSAYAVTPAAVNRLNLGAKYDSTNSNIIFRVYSSRATRIELYIYKNPYNYQENVKYVMVKDS